MHAEITRIDPDDLIPWYLNGSLDADELMILEAWLAENPSANCELEFWKMMMSAIQSQKRLSPSASIWENLIESVDVYRQQSIVTWQKRIFIGIGIGLGILVFIALWWFVQPGVRLQWSVQGPTPVAFRVYRAPKGSEEFTLIREMKAHGELLEYQLTDTFVIPGSDYTYRVEALDDIGRVGSSQLIIHNTLESIPWQLGILLTSVLFGFSAYIVSNILESNLKLRIPVTIV